MTVGNYNNEQRFSCVGVTGASSCPVWINGGESPFFRLAQFRFWQQGGQVEGMQSTYCMVFGNLKFGEN